jgi:hypothetical protein
MTTQTTPTLFDRDDGHRDRAPAQRTYVRLVMSDGGWWTFSRLIEEMRRKYNCTVSTTGVSARIRDLRKKQYGGHAVHRKHLGQGVWAYRLEVNHEG